MRELYPEVEPFRAYRVGVDGPHSLYVEECGRHDGIPALFLHGGPGAGCEPVHRRFFDPARYRVILFDQRGAGRSTPHASLEDNTTQALVRDIETIRETLGIERWVVFGGSWGSTLALVYAQTYPERVAGLVLRGVFLCRRRDIQWFYQEGANRFFPDNWQEFIEHVPEGERNDMVGAYYRILTGDNEIARMAAAKAWSLWEGRAATLKPNPHVIEHFDDPYVALSLARIECHYFAHECFLEPDQIVRDASRLADVPGVIVHGRYDMVCPIEQAFDLRAAWPQADFRVIPDAGHAVTEPGIMEALLDATDRLADHLE